MDNMLYMYDSNAYNDYEDSVDCDDDDDDDDDDAGQECRPSSLSPTELLVTLHTLDPAKADMKAIIKGQPSLINN